MSGNNRDEFSSVTIAAVAKRSAYECAICSAVTVGASEGSSYAVVNIGVAAHINAASPGGPRYDPTMTPKQRSDIRNAIWLCQNHARQIDRDVVKWPTDKLKHLKAAHEREKGDTVGERRKAQRGTRASPRNRTEKNRTRSEGKIIAQESAFTLIGDLIPAYREMLAPMLQDKNLGNHDELGILMGSSQSGQGSAKHEVKWTFFLNATWLRWVLQGRDAGFGLPVDIPPIQIHGQVPAWPDEFFELLQAIVITKTTLRWQRSPHGYLVLAQGAD